MSEDIPLCPYRAYGEKPTPMPRPVDNCGNCRHWRPGRDRYWSPVRKRDPFGFSHGFCLLRMEETISHRTCDCFSRRYFGCEPKPKEEEGEGQ